MINLTNLTLMSSSKPYHTDLTTSKSLHDNSGGHISPVYLGFAGQNQQQSHNPTQHTKEMIPDDKSHKQGIPKTQPPHKKKSFMGRRKPLLTRSAVSCSLPT